MSDLDAASLRDHSRFMFHFKLEMYWLPSEQAYEFDRWLRLPIRDQALLQTAAREHFVRVSKIPPDGDVARVYESFDTLLEQLNNGGEDIDRLTLWFASQFEGIRELDMKPEATNRWIGALLSWAKTDTLALRAELHEIDKRFVTSYHENVLTPHRYIRQETRRASKLWKSAERRLGEFDRLVADLYFDEVRGSPASFLFFFVERRLHREWWRTARSLLNPDQIRGLTDELVEHVSDTDIPETIVWKHVMSIDEAFTIDLFPVFDEVAAPEPLS